MGKSSNAKQLELDPNPSVESLTVNVPQSAKDVVQKALSDNSQATKDAAAAAVKDVVNAQLDGITQKIDDNKKALEGIQDTLQRQKQAQASAASIKRMTLLWRMA